MSGAAVDARELIVYRMEERGRVVFSSQPISLPVGARRTSAARSDLEFRAIKAARAHGLDTRLVLALIQVESGFDPKALSSAGAIGLMQLMPVTAKRFGASDAWDVDENLMAGCKFLSYLLQLFDGDLDLVLAGYNAGEGAVIKHGRAVPPYAETVAYVRSVLHRIGRVDVSQPLHQALDAIPAQSQGPASTSPIVQITRWRVPASGR
ncbi:lytic transglycosylase domain-containing protein [Variovorax saccharolyticus]|uniref:lytic transglycosylase domain-containing protein n=1 Tax=Variovorax saccharolyticus TaxID=3053516 RepID=UPI002575EA2C|nr:lytic transglycosylase domain-containing protein [Variovorax sp. J31P216]MDM0030156.1 lytic transglycosylase domain-containing protein [Variovorax sp. J31P216]